MLKQCTNMSVPVYYKTSGVYVPEWERFMRSDYTILRIEDLWYRHDNPGTQLRRIKDFWSAAYIRSL